MDTVQRHVEKFALDKYEVTLGRFREFYYAFEQEGRKVSPGAGAPQQHPETGWQSAWSSDRRLFPQDIDSLHRSLILAQDVTDYDLDASLPVRGVPWYVASAFCIWDHARLPTEAEWTYAASAGEGRTYPWSDNDGLALGPNRARFSTEEDALTEPSPVGSYSEGRGEYGHEDMAGNVSEWVLDIYQNILDRSCENSDAPGRDPHDCVGVHGGSSERGLRGGAYVHPLLRLRNANRSGDDPSVPNLHVGFRCARDLNQ